MGDLWRFPKISYCFPQDAELKRTLGSDGNFKKWVESDFCSYISALAYPFNPVAASPTTNFLCNNANNTTMGKAPSIALAIIFPHSVLHCP